MVANKHTGKIIIAVMAVAVALCLLAVGFSGTLNELFGGTGVKMEYETRLFNTDEVMSVDIQMDEDAWEAMLANAMTEEYYVCNVVINGKRVNNVAIRPKGNTSLSAIAMDPETDRYSLKLEFDHFVEGQTCYGLDKLILNNNYADATNMKEAVIYDMYQFLGADASLYNYAKVSVNGEYRGVYLALEAVEQSFMLRNFGTQDGELYKPDTMEMGGGNSSSRSSSSSQSMPDKGDVDPDNMPDMGDFDPDNMPDMSGFDPNNMPDMSGFDPSNLPERGSSGSGKGSRPDRSGSGSAAGGAPETSGSPSEAENTDGEESSTAAAENPFSRSNFRPQGRGNSAKGGGANLNYTDDELDSYAAIWDGALTGTSTADHRRVVTALKNVSEGTELETYLDVDNILKYMAVHTFSVNQDSLSGSMAHNYYLYEYNGRLNIFPWDYNLALGGMGQSADATDMVNDAIDTPFAGTKFFDTLLSNEEYLERYHAYLQQLVDEYINGGRFDEVYNRIRNQIDSLVETDPTAFYPYDEYQTAAETLYKTVKRRGESISGQLNGTIPSTDEGQRADPSALIDASDIDVKAMGQFSMGGGAGGFGGFGGRSSKKDEQTAAKKTTEPTTEPTAEPLTEAVTEPAAKTATDNLLNTAIGGQQKSGSRPSAPPNGGGRPDMGDFDPNNMPDMGDFDPNNMPDIGDFDPNNMPDMGDLDPNNRPDQTQEEESQAAEPEESTSSDDASSQTRRSRPDSGMPDQQTSSTRTKNLITYGICFAVMIAALVAVTLLKRKK